MTYELCKKLKDAGFPIKEWDCSCCLEMKGRLEIPTLSELIQACGDRFVMVGNDKAHENFSLGGRNYVLKQQINGENMWRSYAYTGRKEDPIGKIVEEYGNTPEEAVANLWLELNKKTDE